MADRMNTAPEILETIHGVPVADPYRWLEDRASKETGAWIERQNEHFRDYFSDLGTLPSIRARVERVLALESVDMVGKVCDRYFFRRRRAKEEHAKIYVREQGTPSERILVDTSALGPYAVASIHSISSDSSLLAYALRIGGEHTRAIHIVDVKTGETLPDHLGSGLSRGFAFSIMNDGFYYCRENWPTAADAEHTVYFHLFGGMAENDRKLLRLPRTSTSKLVLACEGEMLGAIYCYELDGSMLADFYVARQATAHEWTLLRARQQMPFSPFFYRGRLFAHQFRNTPNGEIIEIDVETGKDIRVIVPEASARLLQCVIVNELIYVRYGNGQGTQIRISSLDGEPRGSLQLEEGYTWGLLSGHTNETNELFLQRESFSIAPAIVQFCPDTGQFALWSQPEAPTSLFSHQMSNHRCTSKDGTVLDITLVGRSSISQPKLCPLTNCRPLIMTANGGFGATFQPQFSAFVSVLLDLGFLFAIPAIRGGGEHGVAWHEAGRRHNRQIVIDDFIASAAWLCTSGFTCPEKMAIFGGSNSGLLIGAAITRSPGSFRAALCIAPLLDMIRYHLFDRARIWSEEYGTADDPKDFQALLAYSPYHQIRDDVNYPATFFVCGDKDSRCNAAHSRKMAARLQERPAQRSSILVDHHPERGHAPAMPLSIRVDSLTKRIAFICHELGVCVPLEAEA